MRMAANAEKSLVLGSLTRTRPGGKGVSRRHPAASSICQRRRAIYHTPISTDIFTHMKTTVEISDSLFAEARRVAQRENRSLRALIEEGLRLVLGQRRGKRGAFKLRPASFGGQGLQTGLNEWDEIRKRAYEGRGE